MPAPEPPVTSAASAACQAELDALRAAYARLQAECVAYAEHRALADRYEQSQVRFRTVFENSPLGHKIVDRDLTIRQANPALAALLGLGSPAELVGRRILEFAHPHHRYDWSALQERLWTHRTPCFSLETCLVRADGTAFWVQVTSVLFLDEASELGYTTLEDISARKQTEADLKRLYDAQETVMHLIAHDLKSPLANIQMLVDVLERDAELSTGTPAEVHAERQAFLGLIRGACGDANALLKDLLYLGELDATRLQKQLTNLNAFLDERLLVYRVAAQERGIDLRLELPDHVVLAAVHPGKLSRVLDNLVSNALKFTPPSGLVQVSLGEHQGRTRLAVRDTGRGIPADLQAEVFDKFSAAARAGLYGTTTTGLGLFISKQIVQLHGGRIWLESQEGAGTTFFIELA